jgi:hypothetical protein
MKQFGITFLILFVFHSISFAQVQILTAPDGSEVIILRDEYGVPHIKGETETGVFYGQGFAAVQDRYYQIEVSRLYNLGKTAQITGEDIDLESNMNVIKMAHTSQERVQAFNDLPVEVQSMLEAFCEGVNTCIDSARVNPDQYLPYDFVSEGLSLEDWSVYDLVAIIQNYISFDNGFGGEELTQLKALQDSGWTWFNENYPINDPAAFTTINEQGKSSPNLFHYSGMVVNPEIIELYRKDNERLKIFKESLNIFIRAGCYDIAIAGTKSKSGNVMLLNHIRTGLPDEYFWEDYTNTVYELELDCPTFNAAGVARADIPGIFLGNNDYFAWSFTDGFSDYIDVYIDSTKDNSFSSYYHNSQWLDFKVIQDTLYKAATPVPFTHYRTIHGPVFLDNLEAHQVFSKKTTSWNKEMNYIIMFYRILKAKNLSEFEDAIRINPHSENFFYAGKDQTIKYWHTGLYQDRSDGVDPRLPHKGDGSEEWGGFIAFEDLPQIENPPEGYIFNSNNKPVNWWNNGDNIPWVGNHHPNCHFDPPCTDFTIPDEIIRCTSTFSFDDLKNFPWTLHTDPNWFDWHNPRSTYEEYHEVSSDRITGANRLPPGESAFTDIYSQDSPHKYDQLPLYRNWDHKRKSFGEIDNPRIMKISCDTTFLSPNSDTLWISAEVLNLENHNAEVFAHFNPLDGSKNDSIPLFDDGTHGDIIAGDDTYSGRLSAPSTGNYFELSASARDLDEQVCLYCEKKLHFTTIGPVKVTNYLEGSYSPRYRTQSFSLILKNFSKVATASNISTVITTSDTCVAQINMEKVAFGDIPAGESREGKEEFSFNYKPECADQRDSLNIEFEIKVYSNGIAYWTNQFDSTGTNLDHSISLQNPPNEFALFQNYPNPFNPTTIINYELPITNYVDLSIYNILGQKVATLVSEKQSAGKYSVIWDAGKCAGGIYFYHIRTDKGYIYTRKLVLLK